MGHPYNTPHDLVMKRIADRRGITVEQLEAEIEAMGEELFFNVEVIDLSVKNIPKPTLFEKACRFLDQLDDLLFGIFRSKQ